MLLGSGVRASAALSGAERAPGSGAGQPALERQIAAVDTARARSSSSKSSTRKQRKKSASVTSSAGTAGSPTSSTVASGSLLSSRMAVSASGGEAQTAVYYTSTKPGKIDVDVADAAALEGLPRIGPVMAKRIVADRDSLGPFGSLKELQRVKGVGPSLARALSPYVTFSLRPRPSRVKEPAGRPGPRRTRRHPPSHL